LLVLGVGVRALLRHRNQYKARHHLTAPSNGTREQLSGTGGAAAQRATIVSAMRYHIWTEGCQMNEADSEKLAAGLAKLGWREAARPEDADLAGVHTCVGRPKAEDRAAGYPGPL